jgi:hypothetical protein
MQVDLSPLHVGVRMFTALVAMDNGRVVGRVKMGALVIG